MSDIQYGPIERWPGKLKSGRERRKATFTVGLTETKKLLAKELHAIRAEDVVVQIAIAPNRWRNDGQPRAGYEMPTGPQIVVSFMKEVTTNTGVRRIPLSFPCDTFENYADNLRAVALSLEALRKVDRYGVTQNAEQYTGFKALPPPGPSHDEIMTVDEAAGFVGSATGFAVAAIKDNKDQWVDAYRLAARKLHADTSADYQDDKWKMLQAAQTILNAHHHL